MESNRGPGVRRGVATLAILGVVAAALAGSQAAVADTAPVDPAEPVTYAADALPTVQIDGVAWDQAIAGNTVYVVGRFTTARPAGSAPGVNTVARQNMLAYNLTTGALITSFAPAFNAQITAVSASPDGSRVYVGGEFTQVSGVTRYRIAGFDTATGALLTAFAPAFNARVSAVKATNSAVYVGGVFSAVGSQSRVRVAEVNATNGAVLPFTARPDNGQVSAFALSPDGSQVVIGGRFTSVNGSSSPGYGLARLDAGTGAMLPLGVNGLVRDAGAKAAITNLNSDATRFYGTGYVSDNTVGDLEGAFAASWDTGELVWLEDCHGDSYDVFPINNVVYTVGHAHDCMNIGGFPPTTPLTYHYGNAFTNFVTGTIARNTLGAYHNWQGKPCPTLLTYFPTFVAGTFTGQSQATWTVTGNADYLVYGGEFPTVNGAGQQGLVRMATKAIAPNKRGPRISGAAFDPVVGSAGTGTAQISWKGNYDRDNQTLVYNLYRKGVTAPVTTQTVTAPFWKLPAMSFADSKLPPGSTQSYRISATDPLGNVATSDWAPVTISGTPVANAPPTAAFTPTVTGLVVQVDGAASSDPDGTIALYAWDFGDGATATGATASHTYATAGTVTVKLTVTDNQGATGTVSHAVTVTSAAGPVALAADTFTRTVSSGWGTGELGGAWSTVGSAANFSVAGGVGNQQVSTAGSTVATYLSGVSSTSTDLQVTMSLDRPATGSGTYTWLQGRRVAAVGDYRAKLHFYSTGVVNLGVERVVAATETALQVVAVPGLPYAAGDQVRVRVQVSGTSPTTVRAKVWRVGGTEPATWLVSATDSTAALQEPGGIGLASYLSSTATNAPVSARYDDLTASTVG